MRSALLCLVALVVLVVVEAKFRETRQNYLGGVREVVDTPLSPECEEAGESCEQSFGRARSGLNDYTPVGDVEKILCDAMRDLQSCLRSSLTEDCLNDVHAIEDHLNELRADYDFYCSS